MWMLISIKVKGDVYHLMNEQIYTIGRKDCDVIIQNDPSISRKHASIISTHAEKALANPASRPSLVLKDISKLGCVVRDERFRGEERSLEDGDIILLGTQGDSKFKAAYEPLVITTSCISGGADKRMVRATMLRLGGHQVSEWRPECHLLVMASLSVTVKVICALVSQKPIVTPQYLDDLIKSYESKTEKPQFEKYLPPLTESQLDPATVSFKPNLRRKTLLRGKTFVFLSSKQYKKLGVVIELAGGKALLLEDGPRTEQESFLVNRNTCVMSNDAQDATQMTQTAQDWNRRVVKLLKKHKKRMITDPEIGFAVLYCSTEKHCNPDITYGENVGKAPVSQSLSQAPVEALEQSDIFAPNTELNTSMKKTRNLDYTRADVTHIADTEAIQIKDENISPQSEKKKPEITRKRARDDPENVLDEGPSKKRQPAPIIKQELMSQEIPVAKKTDKASVTSKSRESAVNEEVYSEIQDDFDSIPTRKHKRRRQENEQNKETLVTPDSIKSLPIDIHDRVLDKGKGVGKKSKGPIVGETSADKLTEKGTDTIKSQAVRSQHLSDRSIPFSNIDDFDQIPSRRNKRQRESVSANEKKNVITESEIVDDFDNIPSRKSRKRQNKSFAETADVEKNTGIVTDAQEQEAQKTNEQVIQDRNQKIANMRVKEEMKEAVHTLSDSGKNEKDSTYHSSDGFLSADSVNMNGVAISEFSKEEGVDSGCIVVKEASLLARKPGEVPKKVKNLGEDSSKWKGRFVRNFKKFRKIHGYSEGLPTIIGGSDLVAHENKSRGDLEAWFRDETEVESQRIREDQATDELFGFNTSIPIRKRRR